MTNRGRQDPEFGTADHAWQVLDAVPDPEVPALSVVDLGVVRALEMADGGYVKVQVTPTYSGCPATSLITTAIELALREAGYKPETETVLSPPWTSDWMSQEGRRKLKDYGIAPPSPCGTRGAAVVIECPRCGSKATSVVSEFGSTACKALLRCNSCLEPFEYFKCI